jgi:hypothetical protein
MSLIKNTIGILGFSVITLVSTQCLASEPSVTEAVSPIVIHVDSLSAVGGQGNVLWDDNSDAVNCTDIGSPSECNSTPGCQWQWHPSYAVGCWPK